jgi:hypothetical protein
VIKIYLMPRWAHSRKARFSRVYAVKSVDPFSFGLAPGQVWARFCDFRGKTGVNKGEGVELLGTHLNMNRFYNNGCGKYIT